MAVFLETLHDRTDRAIPASRVVPDLKLQLPGLFGDDAPDNSVHDALLTTGKTVYYPRRTLYPIDYVGVHARTGAAMDNVDVNAHRSLYGAGWHTEVRASLNNEPGFEAWWEGNPLDPNSVRLSFLWADKLPGISIHTRQWFVFADQSVRQEPIGMVEFMKRRGKGNRWLREVCEAYPVEISALDLHPGENIMRATFTPRDTKRAPFYLQLPLVLETRLRHGVPGRMTIRSYPNVG